MMKKILIGLLILSSFSVFAKNEKLTCRFTAQINEYESGDEVDSLNISDAEIYSFGSESEVIKLSERYSAVLLHKTSERKIALVIHKDYEDLGDNSGSFSSSESIWTGGEYEIGEEKFKTFSIHYAASKHYDIYLNCEISQK